MNKKTVSELLLTLLLLGMLTLAFNVQPVRASGTIYITSDYTFAHNIYEPIVVLADDVVIDGNGYTLQGTGSGIGIELSGRSDVTIKNAEIMEFEYGIRLSSSSSNLISGNAIANNGLGIFVVSSSGNVISSNTITANNEYGIHLSYSSNNNLVVENTFVNDGLSVLSSYGNVVEGNLVNGRPLVYLEGVSDYAVGDAGQVILVNCANITVENLNLSNTKVGVQLWGTDNTKIASNNIANNKYGIYLHFSSSNIISSNTITANAQQGILLSSSSSNLISGNTIANNRWDGVTLSFSSSNVISGNNITANDFSGIWLWFSSSSDIISGNNIANNKYGIYLSSSSSNLISGNTIATNRDGIRSFSSSYNAVFHNNFVDNSVQASSFYDVNVWDDAYPSGGNYWSDHVTVDDFSGVNQDELGSDGIVDEPYVIDEYNRDHYPLVKPFGSPEYLTQKLVETIETWNLPGGTENSLKSKLEEIVHLLDKKNGNGALHKLTDLINQVEALQGKGKLEDWQVDYLIAEAQRIIDLINR